MDEVRVIVIVDEVMQMHVVVDVHQHVYHLVSIGFLFRPVHAFALKTQIVGILSDLDLNLAIVRDTNVGPDAERLQELLEGASDLSYQALLGDLRFSILYSILLLSVVECLLTGEMVPVARVELWLVLRQIRVMLENFAPVEA